MYVLENGESLEITPAQRDRLVAVEAIYDSGADDPATGPGVYYAITAELLERFGNRDSEAWAFIDGVLATEQSDLAGDPVADASNEAECEEALIEAGWERPGGLGSASYFVRPRDGRISHASTWAELAAELLAEV